MQVTVRIRAMEFTVQKRGSGWRTRNGMVFSNVFDALCFEAGRAGLQGINESFLRAHCAPRVDRNATLWEE